MKQNKVPKNEYIRKPSGKKNPYKDDVLYTTEGQWKYPGQVTRIPGGDITMQGVPYPVYGEDDLGYGQMMYPGANYTFPGQYVTEYPMAQMGYNKVPNIEYAEGKGSQYDPVLETVYMDPNDPEDPDKILQHELWHHFQNYNNYLRMPEDFPTIKRPQTPATDEVLQEYYNRKKNDVELLTKGFKDRYPEFEFVPDDVIYNRDIEGYQYTLPWTMEGEGRLAESPEGQEYLQGQGYDMDQYREMLEQAKNRKAYGGDPSLPAITGHYPFGGMYSKTHTHFKKGGWLDQYQTKGEVKSYKPKSIEEYNFRKKMYDDSLSLANMSRKINWFFPENPNISKEEFQRLRELEKTYPQYNFAQEQYDIDQKKGKTRDFKDYIISYHLGPEGSSEPKSVTGYDVSEGEKKLEKKYEEASNKYRKSWVDKQGRKHDFVPDDLRGNSGVESIYDPQTGTTVDRYVDYKYPEANSTLGIYNKYIKPTETLYKGSKNKKEHGKLSTSSKSTGWYDPNKPKPKFKNISNDEYITYSHETESRDLFPFPKTRIVKPDPNAPQGEKMTMESYVNNINKASAVTPDYLPMIQTGMPEMVSREPEIMTSPIFRPSSTNNRVGYRMDPETRKMVPVYLEGKQKVEQGRRIYNKNIPETGFALPEDFVPQFEPSKKEEVVSKKMGGWLDQYQTKGEVIEKSKPVKEYQLPEVTVTDERPGFLDRLTRRLQNTDFVKQLTNRIAESTGGKDWYKDPSKGFGSALAEVAMLPFAAPQLAATYGVTGKVQTPSEAMDIQNPYAAFAVDAVLDPTNLVGAGIADDALKFSSRAGKYLTTKTPLRNAYKINPWAFKPNPEAYYHRSPNLENIINQETGMLQGFGQSDAGRIFSETKDYFPGTTLNLRKPANSRLYFSKGVPLDYGRYNPETFNEAGQRIMTGQGYAGPYMVEVEGVPMGASTKGRSPGRDPMGLETYAVSRRPISLDEAKFYKEDWLRGYKEVPKPTSVSASVENVKPSFQSEIDWGKWNPETPKYPELINEYNAIEESTKKAGTWMKNPDGSVFQGTPEQFIQQQSSHFKKAFPEGHNRVYRGGDNENLANRPHPIVFTANKATGEHYAGGLPFSKVIASPQSQKEYGRALFDLYHPKSSNSITIDNAGKSWREVPRKYFGENPPLRDLHNTKGDFTSTDDIAKWIVANDKNSVRLNNIFDSYDADFVDIVNHKPGNYLKSAIGNVGFFDMTNPNIYKALVPPAGIVGAAALQKEAYGGDPSLPNITGHYAEGGKPPKKSGVKKETLIRQQFKESSFNPSAKSSANARGLAQIRKDVETDAIKAGVLKKGEDIYNPKVNAKVQQWYMDNLYNSSFINKPGKEDVKVAKALAAYNWGRGNMLDHLNAQKAKGVDIYNSMDWLKGVPAETQDYVNKILLKKDPSFEKQYSEAVKKYAYKETGGELDEYDEYRRGGHILYTPPTLRKKAKDKGTSKNVQSSINKIFLRNYDLFGPAGRNVYNPHSKYQSGGGWLDNLD